MASTPFNQPGFTSFMINDILRGIHPGEKRHSIKESIITPSHGQMDTNEDLLPDGRIQEDSFLSPSRNILSSSSSSSSISPSSGCLSSQSSFRSDSFPSSPSSISGYWIPPAHTIGERINKSLPSSITQAPLHMSNGDEGKMRTKNQMMDAKVNEGEVGKGWCDPMIQTLFWHNLLVRRKEVLSSCKTRKGGQIRFTQDQTIMLEKRFLKSKYLAPLERKRICKQIKLTERQVKTWFQNRRAKWRRSQASSDVLDADARNGLSSECRTNSFSFSLSSSSLPSPPSSNHHPFGIHVKEEKINP